MSSKPSTAAASADMPTRPFFRWEVPEQQVVVDVHLNAIELFENAATSAYPSIEAGILLGRIDWSKNLIVTVEHYERVAADGGVAASPFGDRQLMRAHLSRWRRGDSRMSLLGGYRTNPNGQVILNTEDLAALKLIAQNAAEDRGSRLERPRTLAPLRGEGSETPTIFLLIESLSRTAHTAVIYMVRGDRVPIQSSPIPLNRMELSKRAFTKHPESLASPGSPRRNDVVAVENRPEQVRPQGRGKAAWRGNRQWLIVPAAILLLFGVAWTVFFRHPAPSRPTDYSTVTSDSQLDMKLERSGTGWQLSWNTNAPVLSKPTKGRLSVTDGPLRKNVELGNSVLKGGAIVYTPLTDDVVLQLQVDTDDVSEPITESVRIAGGSPSLDTAAAKLPTPSPSEVSGSFSGPATAKPEPAVEPRAKARLTKDSSEILSGAPVSTPVTSNVQRLPLPPRSLPEVAREPKHKVGSLPSVSSSSRSGKQFLATPSIAASPVAVNRPAGMEHIPTISAPVNSTSLPARPSPRGGLIEPAQLISVKNPVYPALAKESRISGTVEVRFKIDTSGEVYDVSVSKGPSILGGAAVEAVRERRYRAARLGGIPVETEGTAVFVFKLD